MSIGARPLVPIRSSTWAITILDLLSRASPTARGIARLAPSEPSRARTIVFISNMLHLRRASHMVTPGRSSGQRQPQIGLAARAGHPRVASAKALLAWPLRAGFRRGRLPWLWLEAMSAAGNEAEPGRDPIALAREAAEAAGSRLGDARVEAGERLDAAREAAGRSLSTARTHAATAAEAAAHALRQKPRLRGVFHQWAFFVSLGAGTALILLATGSTAHVAAAIYAFSLSALLGVSALYHRVNWSPDARRWMRRLDHTMIFVLIAGTYTPFALLVLHGSLAHVVLIAVWVCAGAGTVLNLLWWD